MTNGCLILREAWLGGMMPPIMRLDWKWRIGRGSPLVVSGHAPMSRDRRQGARPAKALAPIWGVMPEGATDTASLEHACGQALPRRALIEAGAIDPLIGLGQFKFQPGASR
jgi:hypothetical protein